MEWMGRVSWSQNDRSGPAFRWARPPLSHGCLSSPQSSILDLADIFAPTPAPPSTHCSADPWDIPGGHAGLQEPPRLAPGSPFLPGRLLAPPFPQLRVAEPQLPLWHGVVVRKGEHVWRTQLLGNDLGNVLLGPVTLAFLSQPVPTWDVA